MPDEPAPRRRYQKRTGLVDMSLKVRPELRAALEREAARRGVTMSLVANECLATCLDVEAES